MNECILEWRRLDNNPNTVTADCRMRGVVRHHPSVNITVRCEVTLHSTAELREHPQQESKFSHANISYRTG